MPVRFGLYFSTGHIAYNQTPRLSIGQVATLVLTVHSTVILLVYMVCDTVFYLVSVRTLFVYLAPALMHPSEFRGGVNQ